MRRHIEAHPEGLWVISRKMSHYWMLMRAQVRHVLKKTFWYNTMEVVGELARHISVERGRLKTYLAINYI